MGEHHPVRVIFLVGQREGDACDWFTQTGDISQADTGQGAECVPLETRSGHTSHLCCFTRDFPAAVALVQVR